MNFTHIIGKSTLKYGFTVPKKMYDQFDLPEKGCRKEIELLFDTNQRTKAWLKRLNNEYGHLQVRYDGSYSENFKNWLKEKFESQNIDAKNLNDFIKIEIINPQLLNIIPFPISKEKLYVSEILTHNLSIEKLISDLRFVEIIESIRSVTYKNLERQAYYNSVIKKELMMRKWLSEQRVVGDKNIFLKCDFRKDELQIEIEFGNARTYYQDIIKFVMSFNVGIIKVGGLIVPSKSFSNHLCHLGHLKAVEKSKGKKSKYSGMMNFEKAANEFNYIKKIFNIPFFIIGINVKK